MSTLDGLHEEKVPFTDRRRFIAMTAEMEETMSKEGYAQVMNQYRGKILPPNHPQVRFVKEVMGRLIQVIDLPNVKWEVK